MSKLPRRKLSTPKSLRPATDHRLQSFWTDQLSWGALGAGGSSLSGMAVTPDTALGLTAYYAAINCISTDIASLPLEVYRRRTDGGRDAVRDDPRHELLAVSPDGETTSMRWRQSWLAHALGWGNGYAEIETTGGGEVLGLYLLEPDVTTPDRRPQDSRLFYRLGNGKTLPPYRVLHLAGLGYDGLKGYTPALLQREAVGLGLATQAFGSTFFGNGTNAEGVLESPNRLSDTAVKHLRESIANVHQGPANAHKLMILEEGATFKKTTVDPEAAQFLQTRQFQVIEIARMFRVPPHKIGDYSQSHLANIEASNLDYLQTTLMPWCRSIEQEINRKLFTAEERAAGFYVEHDMRAFLRGDAKSRAHYYQQLRDLGVLNPNIICALENMNPIGPEGDIRLVPLNMTTLENAGKPAPTPGGPAPNAD